MKQAKKNSEYSEQWIGLGLGLGEKVKVKQIMGVKNE